jgi:hypothetical protein
MDLSIRYQVDGEVSFQRLEDATVIVHLSTGRIHHTNATGSRLWELLEQGRPINEMLAILGQEFEAPAEQIQKDVVDFLELLSKEKMISPIGNAA